MWNDVCYYWVVIRSHNIRWKHVVSWQNLFHLMGRRFNGFFSGRSSHSQPKCALVYWATVNIETDWQGSLLRSPLTLAKISKVQISEGKNPNHVKNSHKYLRVESEHSLIPTTQRFHIYFDPPRMNRRKNNIRFIWRIKQKLLCLFEAPH